LTAGESIGVFGGSFDPIHNGHVVAAQAVAEALELDRVLLVPAGNQWQKSNLATAEQRLQMVALATAGVPRLESSDIDVRRSGPTYTVDTLREIQNQNPGSKLFFILGTDALAGIESWKDADQLLDLAQFVVVSRPGTAFVPPALAAGRVWHLEIPALDLSSTAVRDYLGKGSDVSSLIPAAVLEYITANHLYQVSE
jgi:nicotinate-nucleotide adenylyltransferase